MKRFVVFVIMVISLFSCSSDNVNNPNDEVGSIIISFKDQSETVDFKDYDKITIEGEDCIKLSDLVESVFFDSLIIQYPDIFVFRPIGSDGFYANIKGYGDNTYNHIQHGYIKVSNRLIVFDEGLDVKNGHSIKDTENIRILRKIDIESQASALDTTGVFALEDLTEVTYSDPEDTEYDQQKSIKLSEIIEEIVSDPDNFNYQLLGANGWLSPLIFSWDEMQAGYFLIDMEKSKFNPDLGGKSRVRNLAKIIVIDKSE